MALQPTPRFVLALSFIAALAGCEHTIPIGDPLVGEDAGPCAQVVCDTPPAATCEGGALRQYQPTGTCLEGECQYESALVACAQGCDNNQCQGNTCEGVTCTQPPAPECQGQQLISYAGPGSCSAGICQYTRTVTDCPTGCNNGQCNDNACAGVSCNQPPANVCSSPTTLTTYAAAGTCSQGNCSYGSTETTCPFGCNNGACVNDPCTGVSCNQPPAAFCLNATTRRGWSAPGSCAGGNCTYAPQDTTCPFGCANGACNNDPCAGVSCGNPPAAYCLDANTRRGFQNPGVCAGGSCTYAPQDTACAFGCSNGACNNDPCAGVVCNTPPSSCHQATGVCSNGVCSYAVNNNASCTDNDACTLNDLCQSGVCAGTVKSCTTPPPNVCSSPTSLRTYQATGSCQSQACQYPYAEASCAFGCSAGACQPDPCQGVTCNGPPPATCINPNTLRIFGAGFCQAGNCAYAHVDQTCAAGCSNGACNAPSCGGVTCNTPPLSVCTNSRTLKRFAPLGKCLSGNCNYQELTVECSAGCLNGACLPGSWEKEDFPFPQSPSVCVAGNCFRTQQLAVGGDGTLHVVGINVPANGTILYRRRDAYGWTEEQVDPGMGQRSEAAIALDGQGQPAIAYYDYLNADVRLARKVGAQWSIELVASTDAVGEGVALAFDGQGDPAISFQGRNAAGNRVVAVARRKGGTWTQEALGTWWGGKTDIGLDAQGNLEVAADQLYAVRRNNNWTTVPLPSGAVLRRALGRDPAGRTLVGLTGAMVTIAGTTSSVEPVSSYDLYGLALLDPRLRPLLFPLERRDSGAWHAWPTPDVGGGAHSSNYVDAHYGDDLRLRVLGAYGVMTSPACTPQCGGRTCGNDGCGGTCGNCTGSNQCSSDGVCSRWDYKTFWLPTQSGPQNSLRPYALAGDISAMNIIGGTLHITQSGGGWTSSYINGFSAEGVSRHVGDPLATTSSAAYQWKNGQWSLLGSSSPQSFGSRFFADRDAGGVLHVAGYRCVSSNSSNVARLQYARQENGTWTFSTFGPSSMGCSVVSLGGLAVSPSGKAYAAYTVNDTTTSKGLYLDALTPGASPTSELLEPGYVRFVDLRVDSAGLPHLVFQPSAGGWVYAHKGTTGWIKESLPVGFRPGKLALRQGQALCTLTSESDHSVHVAVRQSTGNWMLERVGTGVGVHDLFTDSAGGSHLLLEENAPNLKDRALLHYVYRP